MSVISVKDEETFRELVAKPGLLVIDFGASWCGPCRRMEPIFNKLAAENPEVQFLKIDIDDLPDIAGEQEVSAVPTFQFLEDGNLIEGLTLLGASEAKLRDNLETLLLGNYQDGEDDDEENNEETDDGSSSGTF